MMEAPFLEPVLREAARDAALSPSSHNAQPCELVLLASDEALRALTEAGAPAGEGTYVAVALDPARCLSALPAHRTEMLVSGGIYTEALATALAARGIRVNLHWRIGGVPSGVARLLAPWEPVAVLHLTPSGAKDSEAVAQLPLLAARMTNRSPYRSEPMPPEVVEELRQAASRAFPEAREVCGVVSLTDRSILAKAGQLVGRYSDRDFTHEAAWRETYAHMRFGPEVIREAETGLPITHLLAKPLPGWQQALLRKVLSPAAMRVLRPLGLARSLARESGRAIAGSGMVLYLHFHEEEPSEATQVAAGGRLLALWLALTARGLALHPVSVMVQHPELRRLLVSELGLPPGRGFFFARAGVPASQLPPAPKRRNAAERVRVA
jgi:nitroreductase